VKRPRRTRASAPPRARPSITTRLRAPNRNRVAPAPHAAAILSTGPRVRPALVDPRLRRLL